jgi:hypothetical protein
MRRGLTSAPCPLAEPDRPETEHLSGTHEPAAVLVTGQLDEREDAQV